MNNHLADRIHRIKPSPTLAISAKAQALKAAGHDVINLSVGEPDFDTPDFIKEAAIKSIRDGFTKYTAVDGTPGLKQAIINKFARDNQLSYEPQQIIASSGAKQSLYNLMQALLNKGDEVVIPAPYWVSYPDMVLLAEGIPVYIHTSIEQHYKISAEQLAAAITPQTKLVILNSPSNPSGMCYSPHELAQLAQVLLEHPKVKIVTDDIYEPILWSTIPFANIVNVCPELYERTVVINGISKAYSMTGWRLGYAAGDAKIINAMKDIQSQSTSNPCSITQVAAQAALEGDQSCIAMMRESYRERHDYVYQSLQEIYGVRCIPADGTFYSFPDCNQLIERLPTIHNDLELADFLLEKAKIAIVPGSAFGNNGCLRISYATSMAHLTNALFRFKQAVHSIL
ncbi:MAG: Aspartate aminotransferase [Gammaproteobacteria bacterium]|jgi:aspartate aminotransferase|nr:Aspartate aminotransferase [Gammaproteobacteria bacterium]